MSQNYKKLVQDAVLDEKTLVKAVFTGGLKQWIKVVIRPVEIKGKRHIQFSYFTKKQDITKNYTGKEINKKLHEILQQRFKTISIQTTLKTFQIEILQKGSATVYQHAVKQKRNIDISHDHQKSLILPANTPVQFLQTIGIQTSDGKIKADKYNKFRQINEFLKIIEQSLTRREGSLAELEIVDFGCGNGYLTFAVYYYFTQILKKQTHLTGVDVQGDLLKKLSKEAKELEWNTIEFNRNSIVDYKPEKNADIVISLHACDTATDEALAKAIQMNSKAIFVSPCCHHNLQEQLDNSPTPSLFQPVFEHGILGERLGDILTDTFRGLILQIMGYQTDIIQFISYEHTTRNLMIRAVKTDHSNIHKYIHEYNALKKYWKVTPYLEKLLGKGLFTSIDPYK